MAEQVTLLALTEVTANKYIFTLFSMHWCRKEC